MEREKDGLKLRQARRISHPSSGPSPGWDGAGAPRLIPLTEPQDGGEGFVNSPLLV
jgi:hypothetical protein